MSDPVRPIAFDQDLLDELERRLAMTGGDLSAFVNTAVARELHGDRPLLHVVGEVDLDALSAAYRDALLARDAQRARAVVADAVAEGADVIDLYTHVLRPALEAIGHGWAVDQLSVAEEHFASEVTAQVIAALATTRRVPAVDGRLAIATCSPDEQHSLGIRMVADVLERAGWEVLLLGAATPPGDLVEMVDAEQPDLVLVSTATAGRLPGVQEILGRLDGLAIRPTIVVGGGLYTDEVAEVARGWGADVVTSDLRALLGELRLRFAAAAGAD